MTASDDISRAAGIAREKPRPGFLTGPARPGFDFLLAVLSGWALAFGLSGTGRFWITWIALVPVFNALYRSGFWRAFLLGGITGASQSVVLWYWVAIITKRMLQSGWLGIFFLACLSVFYALHFGLLYSLASRLIRAQGPNPRLHHRLRLVAFVGCLWVTFEYGYTTLLMLIAQVFPMSLAYSQWKHPVIIQVASVAGIYGVSFLIAAFNAAVADSIHRRKCWLIPCVAGGVLVCFLAGFLHMRALQRESETAQRVAVTVLQGNIPAFDKFDKSKADFLAHRYLKLGGMANRTHPDIIIWTESAVPWPLREDDDLVTTMLRVTEPSRACHILGATFPIAGASNTFYNSVFLVMPDGNITAQYDKRHLLTFVEQTVHIPLMPSSGTIHPAGRKYLRGARPPILDSPVGRIGIMVCNENLYPPAARECADRGSEFIAHLANDAWFDENDPINQHFAVALFRAVETGRDTVVANNIGISAIIDACGNVITRSRVRTHACLSGTVFRRKNLTLYARFGDWFAALCALITAAAVLYASIFPAGSAHARPPESPLSGHGPKPGARDTNAQKERKQSNPEPKPRPTR